MDKIRKMIFDSQDPAIVKTNGDINVMDLKAVIRFMEEMLSKNLKKNNSQVLSYIDGVYS